MTVDANYDNSVACDRCKRHPPHAELMIRYKYCDQCDYVACRECSPIYVEQKVEIEPEIYRKVDTT